MWSWFKSGKAEAPPALEKKTRIPAALKEKFGKAVFAGECRTLTFPSGRDDGSSVFFTAKAADAAFSRWIVQKAAQKPGTNGEAGPVAFKTVCENVGFFDAVERLARFETEHPALCGVEALDTKKDLGPLHFEAVALAEGIVFDTDGLPHPTEEGRILTEGEFSPETLRLASQIRSRTDFAADWQKAAVARMAAAATGGASFDTLMKGRTEAALLKDFLGNLQIVYSMIAIAAVPEGLIQKRRYGNYIRYDQLAELTGADPQALKPFADYDGDIRITGRDNIEYRLMNCETTLARMKDTDLDKNAQKSFQNMLHLMNALHLMIQAKNGFRSKPPGGREYADALKRYKDAMDSETKAMALAPDEADRLAACVFSDAPVALPPEIQTMIGNGWRLAEQAEKRRAQLETAVFRNESRPPDAAPAPAKRRGFLRGALRR